MREYCTARMMVRGGGQVILACPLCLQATMLHNYLPILIFLVIATALALVLLTLGSGLGRYFSRYHDDSAKRSAYECGFETFEDTRMKFDVRYYLVAILFILFDLEIAFLFPWAVALKDIGATGFWAMMIFLAILVVGFLS